MTQNLKDIFKFFAILIASMILAWYVYEFFGNLYLYIYNPPSFFVLGPEIVTPFVWIPSAYCFFVFLLMPIFVPRLYKWIYLLLLIPPIVFLLYFVDLHYFPFIFAIIGWLIGWGVRKLITKLKTARR